MQTILHIGMAKTGSTVLQDRLRASPEALRAHGLLYPANPPGVRFNNHRLLLLGFTAFADLPRHMLKGDLQGPESLPRAYAGFRAHLAAQVAEARPERVILSSESLFRRLRRKDGAALGEALAPYGPVTVAAYLRRPSAYYLSALQQLLKASHKVAAPRALPILRVLDAYRRAFGPEAVRPRIYDRAQLIEGDITADFLAAHLPGSGLAAGDLAQGRRSNETLSAEAMDVLRGFREAFHGARDNVPSADTRSLLRTLARIDAALGAPRPRLRPEIAASIDYARPDPLTLRDDWGLSFPGIDYDRLARGFHDRGIPALLRGRLRPWRLDEIVPIDRDLQQRLLARLASSRWGWLPARALWIAGLRRGVLT